MIESSEGRSFVAPPVTRRKATESILATLKRGTLEQHRSVERLVPLMSEDVSMIDYCWYLTKMLAYSAPVERRLGELPGLARAVPDLGRRAKAQLLRDDLAFLGSISTGPLFPRCTSLPELSSTADALGAMYVLEGATLGGQILSRHLARNLSVGPRSGASFVASYGPEVGPMWRSFGESIEAHARARPEEIDRIVDSARNTFATFERWLSSVDRPEGMVAT